MIMFVLLLFFFLKKKTMCTFKVLSMQHIRFNLVQDKVKTLINNK
jgi:hypothetical protein